MIDFKDQLTMYKINVLDSNYHFFKHIKYRQISQTLNFQSC